MSSLTALRRIARHSSRPSGERGATGGWVLAAASVGLIANLISFRLLRQGAAESVNVQGAYLEVVADLVGSLGVIVGAAVFLATGWVWVDPVVRAALGLWILPRTFRLAAKALRVLVQAAPAGTNPHGLTIEPDDHGGCDDISW